MRSAVIVGGWLWLCAASACGTEPDLGGPPTYYSDIAPMLSEHCASCHQAGGIAPFSLTSYDDAVEHADEALYAVERGIMPPFFASSNDQCSPRFGWKGDPRLSNAEMATMRQWIRGEFPRGEITKIPPPADTTLQGVTSAMTADEGWVTSGDSDQFVCYLLDPGNTEQMWITGMQIRPGNNLVVHHVNISEVTDQPTIDALVAQHGIGKPFTDCPVTPNEIYLHLWTPGNQPVSMPPEVAVPLVPNAKMLLLIHYHPAGHVNDIDFTSLDLRYSNVVPQKMYFGLPIGNETLAPNLEPSDDEAPGAPPEFKVPRDTPDHIERMNRVVDMGSLQNPRLYAASPHMHFAGSHISTQIIRPAGRGDDPANECLFDGGWNFDWQRTYAFDTSLDTLPTIQTGDKIEITCHWNNTLDNPFILRMLAEAGRPPVTSDIYFGLQTTDEMCMQTFGVVADVPLLTTLRGATWRRSSLLAPNSSSPSRM